MSDRLQINVFIVVGMEENNKRQIHILAKNIKPWLADAQYWDGTSSFSASVKEILLQCVQIAAF